MKNMQSQLKAVSKSLAALSKQVEKLSQQVASAQPAKKAAAVRKAVPAKAGKAAAGGQTLLDTVYSAIKRTKKGVTVAQLKQKTRDLETLSNLDGLTGIYNRTRNFLVFK